MTAVAGEAVEDLRALSGVADASAQIGRAVMSDEVTSVDRGEVWVRLERDADYDATVDAVRTHRERLPRYAHRGADLHRGAGTRHPGRGHERRGRPALRRRSVGPLRQGRRAECRDEGRGGRGPCPRGADPAGAHDRGRSRPAARPGSRSEAGRRAPRSRGPARQHHRGQPVRGAEGLRRGGMGRARGAHQRGRLATAAHRHARRRHDPAR